MAEPSYPTFKTRYGYTPYTSPIDGSVGALCTFAFERTGYNQAPPYADSYMYASIRKTLRGPYDVGSGPASDAIVSDVVVMAVNKARAKFTGQLGDSSSFGATLTAELKSSWGLVSGGITSALLAANAVRRGRLSEAARHLNFHPPEVTQVRSKPTRNGGRRKYSRTVWVMPNGRQVAKSLGNKWLWYSYGVAPLTKDIRNGMDVLTRLVPATRVTVGTTCSDSSSYPDSYYQDRFVASASVRIAATVRVSNPNLWLANQLGLINPIQMVNEGIRLSFVVDWFSNLSQIIMQMTDFAGLEITRPVTTSRRLHTHSMLHPDYGPMSASETVYVRESILPEARLVFAYERFEWQRGLNAISLLVQGLKSSSR
jgi:hypothetical protein